MSLSTHPYSFGLTIGFSFFYQISFGTPGVNGELHHWILSPFSQRTGCVLGHMCGFHGKFKNVMLTKNWCRVIFELISSNRVWNYTKGIFRRSARWEDKFDFPLAICIYFSSWRPQGSILELVSEHHISIHKLGLSFFPPASRRGWPFSRHALRSTATAYRRTAKHN